MFRELPDSWAPEFSPPTHTWATIYENSSLVTVSKLSGKNDWKNSAGLGGWEGNRIMSQFVFPSSPSNCIEMCTDLEGCMWMQGLLGISSQLVKVKWRYCGGHTPKKNNFLVPFCFRFASSQQCLMHVIDSLWFFWGRVSWIASCSCSRDHLELTACPPDSYLPLSNQPVNHQAFMHTLCAQQASFAVG